MRKSGWLLLALVLSCGGGGATAKCPCPALDDAACGADGVTYANACSAACAGVRTTSLGRCSRVAGRCDCAPGVTACADSGISYASACDATCAGARVEHAGHCTPPDGGSGGAGGAGGGGTGVACARDADCASAQNQRCCVQPAGPQCTTVYYGSHAMTPCTPPPPAPGPCGSTTCGAGQFCVHPCCGGAPPPPGTPPCTPPPAHCAPAPEAGCQLQPDGFNADCQCA